MYNDVQAFLATKGKGKGSSSSGKAFGRRRNPRDRNGNVMTCRSCGSEEHFAAKCPKGGGKGSSFAGWDNGSENPRVEGQWWPSSASSQSMHYAVRTVHPSTNEWTSRAYNPWETSDLTLEPRSGPTSSVDLDIGSAFPVFLSWLGARHRPIDGGTTLGAQRLDQQRGHSGRAG